MPDSDNTEVMEDVNSTMSMGLIEETTQRTVLALQKQRPVGRSSSNSNSSTDSNTFSGGVIAGIVVGVMIGACLCCACLVCLAKLCT